MKQHYPVFLIAAALALCSASCASTSFSYPGAHTIPEDVIGVSPDRTGLSPQYVEKLDEFGVTWIRSAADWRNIESQEGVWDFSGWDQYISRAEAAGKKIVMLLCYDVPWLYKDNKEHRNFTEREIGYFLKYVEQMVTRYRGRIGAYEIWNEPNGWFWYGSNRRFFALSAAAGKKIKELDPDAVVLAGSLFRVTPRFVRGMFKAGAFDNVDGISLHPYSSDAIHTVRQIDKLRKIMDEFNCAKPIWITEVGYATGGLYFSQCNLENYPEYVVKTLSGLAVRKLEHIVWYELMDEYDAGQQRNNWWAGQYFGLMYPNGDLKNGGEAFKLCSRYLPGAEYRPELPLRNNVQRTVTSLYFRKNNEHTLLLWDNAASAAAAPKTVYVSAPGTPALWRHNITGGGAEETGNEAVFRLTNEPVFLTWTTEEGFSGGAPVLSGRAPGR
ncbi:MAG: cellulase family glycosylhydrolase [Treponema sp.]|jgi:hypothetical protein|nr:cellulase family glycosylhydrolase [Treponema sp.]